jgi:hypothetical protein
MQSVIFDIPATKKSSVEVQLSKFNKRAERLNMEAIVWSWGKAFNKTIDRVINTGVDSFTETQSVLFIPITIEGNLDVSFDGWEFVATLQHLKTGENIIRTLKGSNYEIPVQYRNSGSACEHCRVKRYRKDTYLLSHKNGDTVQVGSSCIKDFLGDNTPENILNKASLVSELHWYLSGSATGGAGGDIVFPILDFLSKTSAIISKYGWVSKSKAYEEGAMSTASMVLDDLLPPQNAGCRPIHVSNADIFKAQDALNWVESLTDEQCLESDYCYNIRTICRSGMVGMKTVGFAASIISSYENHLKKTTAKVKAVSNHVGNVKDKVEFKLTLKVESTFATRYGLTRLYIFNDKDGNEFVWMTSKDEMLKEKSKYLVSGTIKAHDNYKGTAQTHLTRCKVSTSL